MREDATRPCPICLHALEDVQKLRNHIATHLQRIALFTLPHSLDLDEDSKANDLSIRVNNALERESQIISVRSADREADVTEEATIQALVPIEASRTPLNFESLKSLPHEDFSERCMPHIEPAPPDPLAELDGAPRFEMESVAASSPPRRPRLGNLPTYIEMQSFTFSHLADLEVSPPAEDAQSISQAMSIQGYDSTWQSPLPSPPNKTGSQVGSLQSSPTAAFVSPVLEAFHPRFGHPSPEGQLEPFSLNHTPAQSPIELQFPLSNDVQLRAVDRQGVHQAALKDLRVDGAAINPAHAQAQAVTNYDEALSWLNATPDMSNDFLISMFTIKVSSRL